MKKNKEKIIKNCIPIVCIIIVSISLILLFYNTRLLGDDYDYYSYFRHGVQNSILNLENHYYNLNARLFVHSILCDLLSFNSYIPTILFYVLCSGILVLFSSKLINNKNLLFMVPLVGSLFLLLGDYIIVDSELWIAGFLNYVFPMMLLVVYIYYLSNLSSAKNKVLAIIFSFLSAITTEQMAAITVVASLFVLTTNILKKEKIKTNIWCVILSIIGVVFLFSSPGIRNRLMNNSDEGIIYRTMMNFTLISQLIFQTSSLLTLLFISSLAFCYSSLKKLKSKAIAYMMAVFSIVFLCNIIFEVFDVYIYMIIYVLYSACVLWYCIYLCKINDCLPLLFLFCFTAAMGINCISGLAGYRMLYVMGIFLSLLIAHAINSSEIPLKFASSVLLVLCVLSLSKTINIFMINTENAKVWDYNQSKIISYDDSDSIDFLYMYDSGYFPNAFEYFMDSYIKEFGISNKVDINSHPEKRYKALNEDNVVISDDIIMMRETYYMLAREISDYIGASISWREPIATISKDGKNYRIRSFVKGILTSEIGGKTIKLKNETIIINSRLYISIEDINTLFGTKLKVI